MAKAELDYFIFESVVRNEKKWFSDTHFHSRSYQYVVISSKDVLERQQNCVCHERKIGYYIITLHRSATSTNELLSVGKLC